MHRHAYDELVATSYRSPLLSFPDAVASGDAEAPDAGVAWHYGDPIGEQRAAVRGTAMIDLSHRGVIAISGPDRLTWLNTLTSQLLTGLPNGSATQALVLSPNGHVEHHMGVTELDEVTYLDTEPATTEDLLKYLQMMVFWSKVEVGMVELAQVSVLGSTTADVLTAAALPGADLTVGSAVALTGGGFVRRVDDRVDLFLPRTQLADVAATLMAAGARPAGSWAAEALRIPAHTPRLGIDTDDRTIPNEVSWLGSAVHLNKGCYRGQETVARVNNLGRPPRKLVLLHLDGSADRLPGTGSAVTTAEGRVVGRVGTVAHHHEDGPIALAMIKRSLPPGTPLLADGVDATVDPDDLIDDGPAGPPQSAVDRRTFTDIRRR
jgi:folate-binding protein YgfZ